MSLGGWQQVYSPRYMGKSTEADGANCAPRIGAKTASLAVSVCQHHLGRTVLCAHTDPLLIQRAHTLIQARIYKYEGQKSNPHICSRRKYAWYEHTHIHAQPTTDSSPSVSSPCASLSALVSLFHTLPVPRLAPSHSLIMSRWMDFQHAYSTAQHTVSHTPGGIDSWYIFYTVAYCIWLQCVNTWQVFFLITSTRQTRQSPQRLWLHFWSLSPWHVYRWDQRLHRSTVLFIHSFNILSFTPGPYT